MDVRSKHLLLMLIVAVFSTKAATQPISLPNCITKCGSVTIPFPFGTTKHCSLDNTFFINCNKATPFLPHTNQTILSISLNGELRVSWPIASDCYAKRGKLINQTIHQLNLTNLHFSSSRNKLTAVGCDTVGAVKVFDTNGKNYTTGCVSLCNKLDDIITNGSCTGTGCCQAPIPQGHVISKVGYLSVDAVANHAGVDDFNPCGYAFVVEDGAYSFVSTDILKLEKKELPVVLNWAVGKKTCQEAKKNGSSYACKAENSECYNPTDHRDGYLCNCSLGFRGNPYLLHGCQDVNECKESNNCVDEATCINLPGSYYCTCPQGYEGDGKNDGTKCSPKTKTDQITLIISLSVSANVIALLIGSFYAYWAFKKRNLTKLKQHFFEQNGGLLLQQQIAKHRNSTETAKVLTLDELKEATNNFDEDKILGQGGQGTVYKGVLQDNRTVAIKRSKISDPNQVEQFINEVIVLSQINHRNVVKLLGCCLETEFPLLVYEFISNGTIFEHLHDQNKSLELGFRTRLRIATETAGALAYLHSAASTPIIHRDVKTSNILLDHNLTAKVSDFGASRIVPLDHTQITTLVKGTLGYLDPEYFQTSLLTEKSDVYSFGVVLAELLTGKKAFSFDRPEDDRSLGVYFVSSMKDGQLLHIVERQIIDEANQIKEVANIAERCLRLKREDRPTMKEVAMELEGMLAMEETDKLLKASPSALNVENENGVGGSGIKSSNSYSINQISMSFIGGR